MNKQPDNLPLPGDPLELHPDALRELASEYFAEDFPNPDRHECPAPARLQALANTARLPDVPKRWAIWHCSWFQAT